MRIFSVLVSFLLHDEVKSEATEEEKLYTQLFKRYIRAQCGEATTSNTGCANEALTGGALTSALNADGNYHYHMEWENEDDTKQTFEFEQTDDPFAEEEDDESLTFAKWGGANILIESDSFKSIFKKVRQKVFRWIKEKYPLEFPDGRRRRQTDDAEIDDEQIDNDVDDGFDEFINDINQEDELLNFAPKAVNFGKAHPTVPTTTSEHLATTTSKLFVIII